MTSPVARPSRRRQRSTRLLTAVTLIALAAVVVLAAALTGSSGLAALAGAVSIALGAAAVRITYAEVVESRREAGRELAEQAQGYLGLTRERTAEQAVYVADTSGRIAGHEATISDQGAAISRLEAQLADAATELAHARLDLATEQAAAALVGAERDRLARGREDAEERAALAIVRVAELEQELDLVLAEWRAGTSAPRRKHA